MDTNDSHYIHLAYTPIFRYKNNIDGTINPYLAFRGLLTNILNHNKVSDKKIHTILCPVLGVSSGMHPNEAVRQMRVAYGLINIGIPCSPDNANMVESLLK